VLKNCREDVAFINLGYPDNVIGHVHVSWADPNKARAVVVVCGDKRIVFDDLNGLEKVRVFDKGIHPVLSEPESYGEYQLKVRDGDIHSPRIEVREPLKDECRHFLQCIEEGCLPDSDGWSAVTVLQVLEAIDQSVRENGKRIEVSYNDESRPQCAERALAHSASALP
jgi:predicted dehydrogenase